MVIVISPSRFYKKDDGSAVAGVAVCGSRSKAKFTEI